MVFGLVRSGSVSENMFFTFVGRSFAVDVAGRKPIGSVRPSGFAFGGQGFVWRGRFEKEFLVTFVGFG